MALCGVLVFLLYSSSLGITIQSASMNYNLRRKLLCPRRRTFVNICLVMVRNHYFHLFIFIVNELFPSVFRSNSGIRRLWGEICRHHRYIVLFTTTDSRSESSRILTTIQLLTVQSMLMFIMALCYDLQNPQDDGTCRTLSDQKNCEKTTSVFDSASRCKWVDHDGRYQCDYVYQTNESLSVQSVIIISAIVATFTAPINLLVDFLFIEILSAPTPDSSKVEKQESAVIKTFRVGSDIGNKFRNGRLPVSPAKRKLFQKVQTLRQIPVTASSAHQMALENAHSVLGVAQTENEQYVTQRRTIREKSLKVSNDKFLNSPTRTMEDLPIDELFQEFRFDLLQQRSLLSAQVRPIFDEKWGLDANGEFEVRPQVSWFCFLSTLVSAETIVREEMKSVRNETQSKFEKLRLATDVQIGLEMMHLFILDLLGRTSPVAHIFLRKTEQDFRHSMVVSRSWKLLAWIVVICINLFFIYFSLLRGLERGSDWQQSYMTACIFQLIIEVLFYETSECAIVQYVIPDLARHEVNSANFVVMQAVQQICGFHSRGKDVLDAPNYLFVSTNLAKKFPGLLESVIIQSYHNSSPGQFLNIWKNHSGRSSRMNGSHRAKKFFITSLMVAWLQRIGALSPTLQRVIIHMLQPIAASGLVLLWFPLQKYPELWAVVGLIVLYFIYLVYQSFGSDSPQGGNEAGEIMPLESNRKILGESTSAAEGSLPSDSSCDDDMSVQWEGIEESDSDNVDALFDYYFDPSNYRDSSSSQDNEEEEESSLEDINLSTEQWDFPPKSGKFGMMSSSDQNSSSFHSFGDESQVFSDLQTFQQESSDDPIVVVIREPEGLEKCSN